MVTLTDDKNIAALAADFAHMAQTLIDAGSLAARTGMDQIDADIAVCVRNLNDAERNEYQTRALQVLSDIYGRRKA